MTTLSIRARRALRIKKRFRVARLRGLCAVVLLVAGFLAMLGGALSAAPVVFVCAAFVSGTADLYLHRADPALMRLWGTRRAGVTNRVLARLVLLAPLLAGTPFITVGQEQFPVLVALLLAVGIALFSGLTAALRRKRQLPVSTRNIDLARLRIGAAPSRWLTGWPGQRLLHHELVVWAGLAAAVATHSFAPLAVGLTVSGCAMVLVLLLLCASVLNARRIAPAAKVLQKVDAWLGHYRPNVVLYFSGSRESSYQVNMWLETLAGMRARPLVLLRERHLLQQLDPTSLPVLCVPSPVDLMAMDLSSVRVALYPANVGKNIHLLRDPSIKHVFIGHGDSDKIASVNPFSKVYDEIWVGGEAGRDRYALARVGVDDTRIVEVGRPQLDLLRASAAAPVSGVPTVLYAPTWEGWTDEPGNTSLIDAGENIVRELLAVDPPVRILYKPHPFTGIRSPQARRAHEGIMRALAGANRRASRRLVLRGSVRERNRRESAARDLLVARRDLAELEERIRHSAGDEAERMRETARPDLPGLHRLAELRAEADRLFWAAHAPHEHVVVERDGPHLYDCFGPADLLISDVSSVVSDFVATLKPYAITDTVGVGGEEFRLRNTAARGAYVLTPDARGVRGLVESLRFPANDTMREAREAVRAYLLGPAEPPSRVRFSSALARLVDQGNQEQFRREEAAEQPPLTATLLPTPGS
ncbi:hypothetical protein [Streptomyces sp. NPDC050504]|uniref:hypothetical protein n=1 Tax=Streptomyces sp. NPDC050504 TaxID=3365618 RepID=UPI0037A2134C